MNKSLRRIISPIALLAVTVTVLAACVANSQRRGDYDTLTRDQIGSVDGATDLYEVIQRLRPRWLRARGNTSASGLGAAPIVVYQNQARLGTVEVLGDLSPDGVYQLRYMDGPKASATLPGLGSVQVEGAILIFTTAEQVERVVG